MTTESETGPLILDAWQCIGCGRLEAPQPCIGVCQDRRIELVYASEHARLRERLAEAHARNAELESLVRRLALARPRDGEWERSYRRLQDEARRAIGARPEAAAG